MISRRQCVEVGGLAVLGLGLPDLLAARAAGAGAGALGRARRCILFYQEGGMAHQDTWDPKPGAPDGVGGEFGAIRTRVPGVHFSDQIPRLAAINDRFALVRSVSHDISDHNAGAYYCLTGRSPRVGQRLIVGDRRTNFPGTGAIVARFRPPDRAVPPFVHCPNILTNNGEDLPGQRAGWLGGRYDPLVVDDPTGPGFGISPLAGGATLSPDRLLRRRGLLAKMSRSQERLADTGAAAEAGSYQSRALELLTAGETRRACDLSRESDAVRDRYGHHHLGQTFLLARRLCEAGVPLVQVCWGAKSGSDSNQTWDTHRRNFHFLKNSLLPPTDRGLAALILDLEARGMLADTLVVAMGEFGRTPNINSAAGRDHWPHCYSVMLAGGGIRGGAVYGASDERAAYPVEDAVRPEDITATILAALGIDPETILVDPEGRTHALASGKPIAPLFG